jgi:putative nucleotidyltransferase with HDIG domain
MISDDDADIHKITRLLKMDPSFSAEVLRFANSALFGIRGEVTSVSQAIVMVGLDRLKGMATLLALNRVIRSSLRVHALRKVWIHSLITALIAEEAGRVSRRNRESAYSVGLLHNLGMLGLMAVYPDEYARLLASADSAFDLLAAERDLFSIDHCAAGAHLAREWSFPDELSTAIETHHQEPLQGVLSLENLARISWRLSDALGYGICQSQKSWSYEELIALVPDTEGSWLGDSPANVRAEVDYRLSGAPI